MSYLAAEIAKKQADPEYRSSALGAVIVRDDDSVFLAVNDLLTTDDPALIVKARATLNRLIDAEIESDVRDADNKAALCYRDYVLNDVDGDARRAA